MNSSIPAVAQWVLLVSAPASDRDYILGDLAEEFSLRLRDEGLSRAKRWYWAQALRSTLPLVRMLWWRGEFAALLASVLIAVYLPLRALNGLWSFVLSQIPWKAAALYPTEFLIGDAVLAFAGAYAAVAAVRGRKVWSARVALSGMALAFAAASMADGAIPFPYRCAIAAASGLGAYAATWRRQQCAG